jgi:hypothetical protein
MVQVRSLQVTCMKSSVAFGTAEKCPRNHAALHASTRLELYVREGYVRQYCLVFTAGWL